MAKMEDGDLRRAAGIYDMESARLLSNSDSLSNDERNVFISFEDSQNLSILEACKSGDVKMVKKILKNGADLNAIDPATGMNSLLLAIKNGRRDIVMELINHQCWKDLCTFETRDRQNKRCTPMRELIKQYPDIAKKVLDKCITRNGERHEEKLEITYYYELLEDAYSDWASKGPACDQPLSRQSNSSDPSDLIKNHPLTLMVDLERNALLEHPVVRQLIQKKWIAYRAMFHGMVFLYLLFAVCLSSYMAYAKPPYFSKPGNDEFDEERDFCSFAFIPEQPFNDFRVWKRTQAFILGLLIIILAAISLIKEVFQFRIRGAKYFPSLPNCFELFVSVAAIVFVVLYQPCSDDHFLMNTLWQIGAFAVFFAWITLIMIVRKMPHFGVYILMFTNVARSFLRVFSLFVLFVITFALTFHALLQNQEHFSTMYSSIARTMVMMAGEFEYTGIFTSSNASYEHQVFYYPTTDMFFCIFVIVMTILLENLLVGLAVGDIQSIRETAIIAKLALQIQQALEVEFSVPRRFRKTTMISETVYPNRPKSKSCSLFRWCAYTPFGQIFYYIFNIDEATVDARSLEVDNAWEDDEDDMGKVKEMLEDRDKTIQQLQRLLESMNSKFDNFQDEFRKFRQELSKT